MLVQVNTDRTIVNTADISDTVTGVVESTLAGFAKKVTRVEVYFKDENGPKAGPADIACTIEARPAGHAAIAVTHKAADMMEALDGAVDTLFRRLDDLFERLHDPKGNISMAGEQGL